MRQNTLARVLRRRKSMLGGIAMAAAVTMLLGASPSAKEGAQDQVEDLAVCYARGTDAIGYAIHKAPNPNHDTPDDWTDANFTKGLALYRQCFADDFRFNIVLSNGFFIPWSSLINNGSGGDDRALQWANFVNNAFRGPGWVDDVTNRYESTQHQLGSIWSKVDGNTAFLESYLTATHAYDSRPGVGPASGVSVAYGTYQNDVVRVKGTWRIKERTLILRKGVQIP